jgi:uncharacterized protein YndB with AHSA1/START domain
MPSEPPFSSKPSLTIKRRIEAPPEKIFRAWAEPEKITRWFGPEQVEVLHAEADARVGGFYRIVARSPDGEQHEVSGTYREVVPNEKLVFTWTWRSTPERESLVTVLLGADGGGTLLTLVHEQFFDEAARNKHEHGWNGSMDKLERLVLELPQHALTKQGSQQ